MQKNLKVIFFTPYGQWLIHNQVDAVIAKALELRGCEVFLTLCDGIYQDCEITKRVNRQQSEQVCQSCAKTGQSFFKSFQLPSIQLRNFITSDDRDVAHQWIETVDPQTYSSALYQDIPLGQWVTSSIYTYFRISSTGLARPEVQKIHRQYLMDGLLTYNAVSRLLETHQPTHLFLFNGRFAPYRVAFEVAHLHHIDVITHERGLIGDSFSFRDNFTCSSTQPLRDCVDRWKDIPLVELELTQVKQYFTSRERGKDTNWEPFYNYKTDYTEVRRKLRIPPNAKIFSVFTSSEDELAMAKDYTGITNQLEILDRLIEIFKNRDEYLVIRHHPHIGGAGNNKPETDFIARAYQQARSIPKNVRIIMPSEQLTSYALLWHTDAALAFFSTVSIESAARGIPTAVSELSPYSQALMYTLKQDELDAKSLQNLVNCLLSASAKPTIEDLRKLYRFTNSYFFVFSTKFKSFGIKNTHSYDLRIKNFASLQPGNDPALDRICDRILKGTSLYQLPQHEHYTRSPEEENTFLKRELLEIQQYRQHIQQQTLDLDCAEIDLSVGIIYIQAQNISILADWIAHSRHSQISLYQYDSPENKHYQTIIDDLLAILDSCQNSYFLIANPCFQYDESFISSSLDIFTSETHQDTIGILSGAWIASVDGRISGELFTQRNPVSTSDHALAILPSLQHPITLLSFFIFRRQVLVRILNTLKQTPTISKASETVFAILNEAGIHKTELPMIVIHPQPQSPTLSSLTELKNSNFTNAKL